ncbi:MAG: hypothetical protein HQL31_12955, partial [Planctomycetes bacterium]|nr:hypothetical protein [Planctomycetota bacterium]
MKPPITKLHFLAIAGLYTLLVLSSPFAFSADREEIQYNVAVALYNAGSWQQALEKISERRKTDLKPEMQTRYLYLEAMAREKGGQPEEAAKSYRDLLAKDPAHELSPKARLALVYIDYSTGQYAEMLELMKAVKAGTLSAQERQDLCLMKAEALSRSEDTKAALLAWEEAAKAGAEAAIVQPRLFELYLKGARHQELLNLSAKGIPGLDDSLLAMVRAESLLELKRYAEAEKEARKVTADSVHRPRAALACARALMARDHFAAAAEPLTLAIAGLKPPPLSARLALVDCLLVGKQIEPARKALLESAQAIGQMKGEEAQEARKELALLEVRIALLGEDSSEIDL